MSRFSYRLYTLSIASLVGIMMIAGCSKKESSTKATEIPPTAITIMLGAPQIEYAGIYAAISQGYFEDERLDVELVFSISADSSGGGVNSVDAIKAGGPIFSDATAEGILAHRQAGNDLVALLTLYQRDSRSIISMTDKNINQPSDLVGKRLLIVRGNEYITEIFLKSVEIDPNDVTLVEAGDQGVDWLVSQILTSQVDGLVFSIEGATQMEAAGMPTSRIAFYDYGVQSYANVIFTSRQMIEQNPAVVQRFVNAVLRGMQYAIEQPEALAAWFVENYGDQLHPLQVPVQDEAMLAIIPLMQTATSKPGMMSAETWNYLDNDLVELGFLDAAVKPDEAYTLQFIEAYYSK